MRLRLACVAVAVALVLLLGHGTASALRSDSDHAVRAMEVDAAQAAVCTEGQQVLAIKAANESASFRCGPDLILYPTFQETRMQAYVSADSTKAVLLTDIVPNAKFTQSTATQSPEGAGSSPGARSGPGGPDASGSVKVVTYHLTAPELPAEDKTVVFKCSKNTSEGNPAQRTGEAQPQASEGCVVVINVAKSAASKEMKNMTWLCRSFISQMFYGAPIRTG